MTGRFHPLIEDWFARTLGVPTEPQLRGWPEIGAGRDVLISAPTGSGKTLAAFLSSLDGLVRLAETGGLPDETVVVYVSPLKALTNDVRKNLETPLAEIRALADERGIALQTIRTAVRTGDTPASERARMVRKPPHILVTTPESLFLYLTAERSRATLAHVHTIVVDEVHAIAADKRGSHLMLTLARLDALVHAHGGAAPQRIALSATVRPIEEVADFVSPGASIVDVGRRRAMDLSVEVPSDELGHVATNEMWADIYDRMCDLIRAHRTTLIFVGTRRLAERVAFALAQRLGDGMVLPHHGSLSRTHRLETETKLKAGELRAVVATASLELGIDIGTIDLAIQIGSPRSIAVALQRIGRSGHWVGAKPKGVLFATTRDELVECAAVVRAIRAGEMDRLRIPKAPLDILAQQIVAACSADEWREDDLFDLVRTARPYADLPRADFDAVLAMLGDGIATSRGRAGTLLHRDLVNGRVRARRGARMAAITSGGAIPDRADYSVVVEPDGLKVGTVDEDFAVESMAGDIFLLGQTSWKIRRVERDTVRVENAHGAPPSIPFWRGEGLGRSVELSADVARVRELVAACPDDASAVALLEDGCGLDRSGAEQLVAYVRAGVAGLGGALPTDTTIVAERFFDEAGGMQLVLHAPFGARINRAWGLALRKKFCRTFDIELQAAATDNGIVISLSEQHAFPLDAVFAYVTTGSVAYTLTQALLDSPMFGARFRWNATRSLAILRMRGGRRVAPQIVRMRSEDLLGAVFPDQVACAENLSGPIRIPDHVLVRETIENCLYEAMDLVGLKAVLAGIEDGTVRTIAVETAAASPFAHEILNASPYAFLDDAPLEERRAREVRLRSVVGSDAADGVGLLDAAAIDAVAAEAWPLVRDRDELHDALLTLVALPPVDAWAAYFAGLRDDRRADVVRVGDREFWVAAERLELVRRALPSVVVPAGFAGISAAQSIPETREAALAEIVRGWLESSGPSCASDLAARFAADVDAVDLALLQLESEGQVLRGRFRADQGDAWCNRRVLARIHRRTLGALRREIEPVTTVQFVRFLQRWQHATPLTRLHGVEGTLAVIRQLEGFEAPAAAWETQILPRRVTNYRRDYLDTLCRSGDVMWGRLSTHPRLAAAANGIEDRPPGRIRPTKLVPITLFLRDGAETLVARAAIDESRLSGAARDVIESIRARRAPFFAELVRDTRRLPAEVEEALFELVAAGLVSADGFDALRSLAESKRRLGAGTERSRPRSSSGRWTLLESDRAEVDHEAFTRRILARYGVVFRDLVKRETLAPAWRDVLRILRRLEAQGEIRGGRFIDGFIGEQFALPEALDALRAARRDGDLSPLETVSYADPLHLAGVVLPAEPEPRPAESIGAAG